MDDLASVVGCIPNIGKFLITDTWLALNLWFGPYYPYVFRLTGPKSWSGARDAILSADTRKRCGMLGVDKLNKKNEEINSSFKFIKIIFIGFIIFWFFKFF